MMEDNRPSESKMMARNKPAGKKSYQKPAFRHERVFETMALVCGKTAGVQGRCNVVKKNS